MPKSSKLPKISQRSKIDGNHIKTWNLSKNLKFSQRSKLLKTRISKLLKFAQKPKITQRHEIAQNYLKKVFYKSEFTRKLKITCKPENASKLEITQAFDRCELVSTASLGEFWAAVMRYIASRKWHRPAFASTDMRCHMAHISGYTYGALWYF